MSIIFIAGVKTASEYMADTIALNSALPRYDISNYNHTKINNLPDYGFVGKMHQRPSKELIDFILSTGQKRLIVHHRCPKDAALSRLHHRNRLEAPHSDWNKLSFEEKVREFVPVYEEYKDWNHEWYTFMDDRIQIRHTSFENMVKWKNTFWEMVLNFIGLDLIGLPDKASNCNFRKGEVGSFEIEVPKELKALFK